MCIVSNFSALFLYTGTRRNVGLLSVQFFLNIQPWSLTFYLLNYLKKNRSYTKQQKLSIDKLNRDLCMAFHSMNDILVKILNKNFSITINIKNGKITADYVNSFLQTMDNLNICLLYTSPSPRD